jgi:hypothetical protein
MPAGGPGTPPTGPCRRERTADPTSCAEQPEDAVLTRVKCENCGARYETPTPPDLVERIRRCVECGRRGLVVEPAGGFEEAGVASPGHHLYLYRDEAELARRVAADLGQALATGAAVVMFATQAHARDIERELASRGAAASGAGGGDRLVIIDAETALADITVDGTVNRAAFHRVVGGALDTVARRGQPVHAYGEIVDLLWQAGDVAGAVELERLWNELIGEWDLSLLCAYRSAAVAEAENEAAIAELRRLHSSLSGPPPG